MTAAQLAHLAELAAFAADYFATSDPRTARTFGDTARRADTLSAEIQRDETEARNGTSMSFPLGVSNSDAL
ncbi:MAG: hypothetical protein ABSH29_25940 [Acidimicrobiales bacterium]